MKMVKRFQLQCLLAMFWIVLSLQQNVEETNSDNDQDRDFVDMSPPPDPFTWRSRLKVKYVCTTDKIVGVSLFISTPFHSNVFHSWKIWRCRGNSETLRIRRVRIRLADDIAFRPSLFNKRSTFVENAKLVVWMVDVITWWKVAEKDRHDIHHWALSGREFSVNVAPPYSRSYKTFRRSCVPWFWSLQRNPRLSWVLEVCPQEQTVVAMLSFPVALNGLRYGLLRSLSPFTDPVLEAERSRSLLKPRFSVELWVYVLEYCPTFHQTGKPCTLFSHISTLEDHLTPVILVNHEGQLQVEGQGPAMYVAHLTTFAIPLRQWVRILFTLQDRTWVLECSFGKSHNITRKTQVVYDSDVHYDDTQGVYVIGGIDGRLGSIKGYIGRVRLYRNRILTMEELPLPDPGEAMFQLDVRSKEEHCREFWQWWSPLVRFYTHKAAIYQYRHFCPNSYKRFMLRRAASPLLRACPRQPGVIPKHKKRLARLLRSAVVRDGDLTEREIDVIAKRLLDDVTDYVEEKGLTNLRLQLPRVEQSSCLGNWDATYTLAVFLNNGVATSIQEAESLSLLMQGTFHRHRLSSLALGHRHAMGIDGVPWDMDMAYLYYKDVGDKSKEDVENHPEDQVATEIIRLVDEQTLEQQTDETGDLFMWLKHQAQQGVASAQLHLAHLYFWGSQGLKRNLQAARLLFQQGAEQGDADSIYNLGMMDLLGRGGSEKNETAGEEQLKKVAEKEHPYAVSALGWIALEREKNFTKAASYFEQAYRLNFMDAGYYLGHMFQTGIYPNKTQDYDTALYYYEWAAARGHVIAALLFAQLINRGTPKMKRSSFFAMEWARYIAEKNSVIGQLLRKGVQAYREGNIPLAAYYYLLTSDTGIEVASFNMAWLCEERKEQVTAAISKECQWRHYNLTVQRQGQFVDPYSYIKMGDYFWYGCQGKRNITQAAQYYAAAGRKREPHALFNLAFMVEEGVAIPRSVWQSLGLGGRHYRNNVTLLSELYERCRESEKSEAFIPCTLALYRVWVTDVWNRYHLYLQTSTYLGMAVAVLGTIYFVIQCTSRLRRHRVELYQL